MDSNSISIQQSNALPEQWKHIHALLVDDNIINLKLAKTLLNNQGVTVKTADNGEAAIQICKKQHFDMIFMDLHMPRTDGFEATDFIRNNDNQCRDSIIIALTANAMPEEQLGAFNIGMNDILVKPISEKNLSDVLHRWLSRIEEEKDAEPVNEDIRNEDDTPVFDKQQGIELAGGNGQLADELLTMLLKELPDHRMRLQSARQSDHSADLKQATHKLHGATSYCGVPQLRKAARYLEEIIDNNEPDKLDSAYTDVLNAIDSIIEYHRQHDNGLHQ